MFKEGIHYRKGTWGMDEEESSNFREFKNVEDALREEAATRNLQNAHICLYTDNSTVKATFGKGNLFNENCLSSLWKTLRSHMCWAKA
jgi:hypothetical protein